MDICNESCLAGELAILRGKNFNIGHDMQTVPPHYLIPAMHIGTIDFYHFIPLSQTWP